MYCLQKLQHFQKLSTVLNIGDHSSEMYHLTKIGYFQKLIVVLIECITLCYKTLQSIIRQNIHPFEEWFNKIPRKAIDYSLSIYLALMKVNPISAILALMVVNRFKNLTSIIGWNHSANSIFKILAKILIFWTYLAIPVVHSWFCHFIDHHQEFQKRKLRQVKVFSSTDESSTVTNYKNSHK